jgi:murein L,D-transpeptidase YafK
MRSIFLILGLIFTGGLLAQPPQQRDFISFQKSFKRVDAAFLKMESILQTEFEAKGMQWPAKYMYIRSFKLDSKLEVWVKNDASKPYRKFKTYNVCALAGSLGPKRLEGDYQVPEGFYYINEFKPNSNYHLALGVNYPNASDRILSDPKKPGGEIFVHGSCVTVGCIPLTDPIIEELYVIAASTRAAGQDFIPIHVFPIMFKNEKSKDLLDKYLENRPDYKPLANMLEKVYYYFQEKKQLPTIVINGAGEYDMLQDFTIPKRPVAPPPPVFKENTAARKTGKQQAFTSKELVGYISQQPEYPGGATAYKAFIDGLDAELSQFIPIGGRERLYITVEFVITADGKVFNVKPDKNANNEMNNLIIQRFEALPSWKPALGQKENPIPRLLSQTIVVNRIDKPVVPVKVLDDED